jgi:hypothetical protein
MERDGQDAMFFKTCEMWNQKGEYRCDGIWDGKQHVGIERNYFYSGVQDKLDRGRFHSPCSCVVEGFDRQPVIVCDNSIQMHHWGMATDRLRRERVDKWNRLDPDKKWQWGYDYMLDERGLQLVMGEGVDELVLRSSLFND